MTERYDEAISALGSALNRAPNDLWAHLLLAFVYAILGNEKDARFEVSEVLRINPHYSFACAENIVKSYEDKAIRKKLTEGLHKAGLLKKPPSPIPEKPSIAVLPFVNISGDPKEDYLSDGITEQIITALSKTPKMLVIARNSVFTYKGKPVKVQQVSKELGVRYVLEGSVQKSGDRLRITAQLIDATSGNNIWGESFDRTLNDIFVLQDDITRNVIMALQVNLTEGDTARLFGRDTNNLKAYLKVQQGLHHVYRWNKNDNEMGRQLYKEAIALDPAYESAYVLLGWTYRHEAALGWTKTPKKSSEEAIELTKKALSLDPLNASAYRLAALVYAEDGQLGKAMKNSEKAISLEPNNSDMNFGHGLILNIAGEYKKAIPLFEKAIKFDPIPPFFYFGALGLAYFRTGQDEEAVEKFKKASEGSPPGFPKYIAFLGCTLLSEGKPKKALIEFDKALKGNRKPQTWIIGNRAIALVGRSR